MSIILLFFIIAFQAAWLWFSFVYFTQDHSFSWQEMIFWILLMALLRVPLRFLTMDSDTTLMIWAERLGSIVINGGFLFLLLGWRFHVEELNLRLKIVIMFLIGTILFSSAISLVT